METVELFPSTIEFEPPLYPQQYALSSELVTQLCLFPVAIESIKPTSDSIKIFLGVLESCPEIKALLV